MCFKSSSKVPKNLVWNQFCLGSCWLSVGFLDSWNGFAPCSWYDRPDLGCVGAPTWRCCFWLGSINQAVLIDVFCSCSAAFVVFILSGLTMIFMDFEQRLKTIARTLVSSRTLEGNYAAKVMFNYLTTKKKHCHFTRFQLLNIRLFYEPFIVLYMTIEWIKEISYIYRTKTRLQIKSHHPQ